MSRRTYLPAGKRVFQVSHIKRRWQTWEVIADHATEAIQRVLANEPKLMATDLTVRPTFPEDDE